MLEGEGLFLEWTQRDGRPVYTEFLALGDYLSPRWGCGMGKLICGTDGIMGRRGSDRPTVVDGSRGRSPHL